jgi:hypothetical protein
MNKVRENTIDEKLMTLIDRRMEDAAHPIPQTIKLGSLRDIGRELGMHKGQGDDA